MIIKTAKDILVKHNARFFMTMLDDTLLNQKWHAPPQVIELQDEIRPYLHDFENRNFLDWAKVKGYAISHSGHPLEEAHASAASIMLDKIQDL